MKQLFNIKRLFYAGMVLTFIFPTLAVMAQEDLPPAGKPLALEECIAIALKYHPSLGAGQATLEAQRAKVEQALAAYYPQIDFKTTYSTATANYSSARSPANSWNFNNFLSTGPSLNQLIYDFGRTTNSVKINRENAVASEQDLQTARQNITLNVRQTYYGALQSLALIKVAEETLTQNQQRLTQAQGFFKAGTRSKIDVTKAEIDLANVQLALIRAKNSYLVARANLNNAMGLQEGLRFALVEAVDFNPTEVPLEKILQSAFTRRPEILQLKAKQRSQEAAVELFRTGYYPTISGNLSNTWRTDEVPNDMAWDWSVGAALTVPIFSGFSTQNQIAEASAQLRSLTAQEESLRQIIRLEAEQAYLNLHEALERIAVTRKSIDQAQENYNLASGRYQVGAGQTLEINDAEVLLANARANHINALYDYKTAQARIEKAMGQTGSEISPQGKEK
ncbi:MAG: TolC family protein [Desulfobacterales bacterium]|nr:TolC family protein [Desulfobacterales bacterium]